MRLTRRRFLSALTTLYALPAVAGRSEASARDDLVGSIETAVLFHGRQTGKTWFHPRPCLVPSEGKNAVLMTMQTIQGSDNFGPVQWTVSKDRGNTWSEPTPVPGFERRFIDVGKGTDIWEEGVCDVVPEFHPRTRTVLAMGHNVYYKNNVLARPQRERCPVYAIRAEDGIWSAGKKLEWNDPRASEIFTCGCAQRVTLSSGEILVPVSFAAKGMPLRSVTTLRCDFNGDALTIRDVGRELKGTTGRGLLEPSLVVWKGTYYLTIRAEDGRGYVSTSADGLEWGAPRSWCWDDGEPLDMSTTQQRWLPHGTGLYLTYTRRSEENAKVFRYRGPIYLARLDPTNLRLIRDTERVVFPLRWETPRDPNHLARMGNFHTVAVTPEESWIMVGEEFPTNQWRGDTLLARVLWRLPNDLVGG